MCLRVGTGPSCCCYRVTSSTLSGRVSFSVCISLYLSLSLLSLRVGTGPSYCCNRVTSSTLSGRVSLSLSLCLSRLSFLSLLISLSIYPFSLSQYVRTTEQSLCVHTTHHEQISLLQGGKKISKSKKLQKKIEKSVRK